MVKQFIPLKRFIRDSNKGFTLLELLVALIVASIVLGVALKFIVDQRKLFAEDQTRTQVNQNLRAALDLVGTDIKQTGERLVGNTNFPMVQVIDGGTSAAGDPLPDELVLQRKVIDQELPVCANVSGNQSTIVVSIQSTPTSTVCPYSNSNADPLPNNLEQWRDTRYSKDGDLANNRFTSVANDGCIEQGGTDRECLWAYIYNPANNLGEFFLYDSEDSSTSGTQTLYRIHRAQSSDPLKNNWRFSYNVANNPVLYILEERRYRLRFNDPNPNNTNIPPSPWGDNVLQLILNRQDGISPNNIGKPIGLVNQLSNFQVQALMQNGITQNSFNATANATAPFYSDDWQQRQLLKAIGVTLTARNPNQGSINVPNLNISGQFFPRNVASKK